MGVDTLDGWLTTPDGVQLYTKTWKPAEVKARLVFLHGFSDHCNFYPALFTTLAENGIKVYSLDQSTLLLYHMVCSPPTHSANTPPAGGWGRSVRLPKQKGQTGSNEQVMTDITTFIQSLPSDETAPLFLMGHSMGGGETLVYASTGPKHVVSRIRGFLLESPLIGLGKDATPFKITVALGRLAARIAPTMTMVQKLDASKLCRDPAVCKAWVDDDLCHDTASLAGLAGLLDRTGNLNEGRIVLAEGIGEGGKTRVWIGHGSADQICDFDASRRWFDRIQVEDKEFQAYDGWYHKLHSEPNGDGERFAGDVVRWILNRSGPLETVRPKPKL